MKLTFAATAALLPALALAANHFRGLTAANAIGGNGAYTCRSQAQWNTLANDARNTGFTSIRIEGFDCNALDMASSAAAAAGLQVMAGIYVNGNIAQGMVGINNDVQTFVAAYKKYGAGRYIGLTVGNEVNDSVYNIMQKVYDVRGYLRSIGVSTPVSTAHTWVFVRDNPEMCNGDFGAANAHAFFDPNTQSGGAGNFLLNVVRPALDRACGGKVWYITESGWPSRGNRLNQAQPSLGDETSALTQLNCAARSMYVYAFEYDDQYWKNGATEQSFGIFGKVDLNGNILKAC
ncbi:glycoside hydrolase family 17 protein [Botryobasidium botryosum FD-172 SS1]|uniref:glucan endo-1,3-beta-D-glucosidase n=1 Tax=Botryobasidium botryosum (strain FD-172 SS1) TaxID=930990 RepID=A0A067LXY4_BOTB1|nr:glycoside hydrolase family 17 protein [Botryobasidium botryosum FD-172 SS1]